ncbi:hypothetical protein DY037_05750 [Apilactobacillus micheneri]|uniref:hypothetical protein n=1 Tax=Apilactobacillus micheneri TaxID=1899430 RepID=UPI00112DBA86|nr:hypothetical protein [Apilactobacillus micheneri]TPR49285.1 hypothetical protein DY037_05750 [Apilactobacillus micheneri]
MTNNKALININLSEEDEKNILDIVNLCNNLYSSQLKDIKYILNSKTSSYANQVEQLVNCNNQKTYDRAYSKHVNNDNNFIFNHDFYNGSNQDAINPYISFKNGVINYYYNYDLDNFIDKLNQDFEKQVVVTITNYLVGKYTNNLPNFLADYIDFKTLKEHPSAVFDYLQAWWQNNAPKKQDIKTFGNEQVQIIKKQNIQQYQDQWRDTLDSCVLDFNYMDKPKNANLKIGNITNSYDINNSDVADTLIQLISKSFNQSLKSNMNKALPLNDNVKNVDFSNCSGLFENDIIKSIYFCQDNTITLKFKKPEQAQFMYEKLRELYREYMLS